MKTLRKTLTSIATLLAVCLVHAADSKPIQRVIAIYDVDTDDPSGYATWIGQYNEVAKAKLGTANYLRVFETRFDGNKTRSVRASVAATSVAELMKNAKALENDPAIVQNRDHLRTIRKLGALTLYQAVRFDGTDKNGSIYGTLAVVTDEAGYLKAVDQLRVLLDGAGLKDAKINVYRILAGRTNHTHRVNIAVPSEERLAAFLDTMATNAQMAEWVASSAKFRTVVSNATSREITK